MDRFFNLLADALERGSSMMIDGVETVIDSCWYLDQFVRASGHDLPASSVSHAVDGTDIQSWARLHGSIDDIDDELDDEDKDVPAPTPKPRAEKERRAKVFGTGPDGRNIYTKDPDARGGRRSAISSRDAGKYVGYELHLAVQARDAGWSDGIERLNLGSDVPPVITMVSLVPAGSHRDDAVVPKLIAEKVAGLEIEDVIWDRGYSQLRPEMTSHPLNQAGIQQTFRPKERQRALKPFNEYAVLIEGHLVSASAPRHLQGLLPMPPMGSTAKVKATYEQAFNQLASYRFERLARPDADGTTRWMCPFHAGRLRTRAVPETMRGSRAAPLIELPDGARCCDGTVGVQAAELPHWQEVPARTTAWRISFGRRQAVEGANGMLKGGFVNIAHKFFRVFGLTKMRILLAATIVGCNLETIRSFLVRKAGEAEAAEKPRTRKKRRKGTWRDVVAIRPATGPDPPPA